jgi:hypothetical protein
MDNQRVIRPRGAGRAADPAGPPAPPGRATHRPVRPLWTCLACEREWPCEPGKVELMRQYAHDRVGLLVYLAGLLVNAVHDVEGVPPKALMERFVKWAKAGTPG